LVNPAEPSASCCYEIKSFEQRYHDYYGGKGLRQRDIFVEHRVAYGRAKPYKYYQLVHA
jgi:hypothetical protein